MLSTPENLKQDRVNSANCATVLEVLNAMLRGVLSSLPQIREATRRLPSPAVASDAGDEVI